VNGRLRNRLAVSDWKRRIFVRAVSNAGWHEQVPRDPVDRIVDSEILDPLLLQQLDEPPARTALLVLYGRCHHVSAEASIA
jgi:hypothetical protein